MKMDEYLEMEQFSFLERYGMSFGDDGEGGDEDTSEQWGN